MEICFQRQYYVYILSNKEKDHLITGVTGDLPAQLSHWRYINDQEQESKEKGFYMVYQERFHDVKVAMEREEKINRLSDKKKHKLITSFNPSWEFLSSEDIS